MNFIFPTSSALWAPSPKEKGGKFEIQKALSGKTEGAFASLQPLSASSALWAPSPKEKGGKRLCLRGKERYKPKNLCQ